MVLRDVVRNVFARLGMAGAILLVSALIFGALAGGVVVQRLYSSPAASSEHPGTDETGVHNQSTANDMESNTGDHDGQENNDAEDKDA